MGRKVAWIAVELILSVLVALVILTAWQGFLGGSIAAGFFEAAYALFLFMDVGLVAFLLWLILRAVRSARPFAALGATGAVVLNLVVVLIVGLVQGGETPFGFLSLALTAGIAFVLAVLVATPIAHGLTRERND
jgi:hypothetical protein